MVQKDKELIKNVLKKQVKKEQRKKYYYLGIVVGVILLVLFFYFFQFQLTSTKTINSTNKTQDLSGIQQQQNQSNEKPALKKTVSSDSICNNNKKDVLEQGIDCGGICLKNCET